MIPFPYFEATIHYDRRAPKSAGFPTGPELHQWLSAHLLDGEELSVDLVVSASETRQYGTTQPPVTRGEFLQMFPDPDRFSAFLAEFALGGDLIQRMMAGLPPPFSRRASARRRKKNQRKH